ncbi:MAG: FtsQ-type POTRA domain-containing protein [Clostridiaceae bacterium]
MNDRKDNQLIIKRRKKRIRRRFFVFSLLLIITSIALAFNLKTFDIKEIFVKNNVKVTKDDIINLSGISIGDNIFYVSFYKSKKNILSNPYIKTVKLKRKLPGSIEISVTERNEAVYFQKENSFYILDETGVFLKKSSEAPALLKIKGIENKVSYEKNSILFKDSRYKYAIEKFSILDFSSKYNKYKFKSVDLSSLVNIKLYINNMEIRLGSDEDLLDKVNKAISIMSKDGVSLEKGYIDVSFKGIPVFYIEK